MTNDSVSIYERIGGHDALTVVVDDLYVRIMDDPKLAGFFTGTNLAKLKGRQVEFFSAALGGPDVYDGGPMGAVHRGRGIEQAHFDLVAAHLIDALKAAGVPGETVDEIVGVVAPLSDDIVGGSDTARSAAD
ncbi:group I truncated hemoglobin [Streptomonospora litoralis]|uniref:Group 1 truncated hemoglobin n=1 Tax=Streptomonospora litoralis TaxID=2498135 RepID=A0A4P6Q6V8_9ACTN|nr:group 1 truncated hemoglobin [Streptomonospora litoralis]QBI56516.1 Group 1 truncated hemoglobin GlbN [Streptomonospora litoralis]